VRKQIPLTPQRRLVNYFIARRYAIYAAHYAGLLVERGGIPYHAGQKGTEEQNQTARHLKMRSAQPMGVGRLKYFALFSTFDASGCNRVTSVSISASVFRC
jgi:hypothetical protein